MATNGVENFASVTYISGNTITLTGNTLTSTTSLLAFSSKGFFVEAVGDVHGIIRLTFGDPETLGGMLSPAELSTAQVRLVDSGAGASCAIICRELFAN